MAELLEYKCPCCNGALEFNSTTQKLQCPFCGNTFAMDTVKAYDDVLSEEPAEDMRWDDFRKQNGDYSVEDGMTVYACKSCGGQIIVDSTTAATACPYCGNQVVMMNQLSGEMKPDFVIPFKLDKEAAKAALKEHYKGKKLLPSVFVDNNHIDEIKGVYVPFWVYNCDVSADIRYKGDKVRNWSDSQNNYTETSTYLILRSGSIGFDSVPVDGSEKMPDELMESIEPYDMSEAVDFQTAYLAGYLADKYDVDSETAIQKANSRIKSSTESAFAGTISGYTGIVTENSSLQLKQGKSGYGLLPVWLLSTKWNGKNYLFAMNGQTGKLVGDLPIDKKLASKAFWLRTLIATAVFAGALLLINLL